MRPSAPPQLDARASAGWQWRSGSTGLFDGQKFRGALRAAYPSGYDLDYATIRAHARVARWDSAYARAILRRLVDNVIGTGMSANAAPMWEVIGGTMADDAKAALARKISQQFALYMQSHEPDATGRMTGYELQAFEFLNELGDGEAVIIQRFSGLSSRMSPVNLQFIDPDQVSTPYDGIAKTAADAAGNTLVDGFEVDTYGKEIAVYVQDPKDLSRTKYTRVPVNGPSGRRFVLHPGNYELVGQVRGIPILAPIIHDLQKITDYSLSELESAVINAVIAGYEVAGDSGKTSGFATGVQKAGAAVRDAGTSRVATAKIEAPGIWINHLPKGGDIKSFDTKRPNVNFGEFVKAVMRYIAAALSIPLEVLEESFNANYSASRASLILFWQRVENWRESLISQFLQPWYDTWFAEAARAGRFEAPGWNGADPVVRAAWLNVNWIGVSMPSIDPTKDADADDKRIAQGSTTREQVAMKYNGSDYGENVERLGRENEALAAANKSMQPPVPVGPTQAQADQAVADAEDQGQKAAAQAADRARMEAERAARAEREAMEARHAKDTQQILFSFERGRAEIKAFADAQGKIEGKLDDLLTRPEPQPPDPQPAPVINIAPAPVTVINEAKGATKTTVTHNPDGSIKETISEPVEARK
jgi:lambda family phage portal protein